MANLVRNIENARVATAKRHQNNAATGRRPLASLASKPLIVYPDFAVKTINA